MTWQRQDNAKTTPRIRKEIQNANASITELAKTYNLTPKIVSKWKSSATTEDGMSGGNRTSRSLTMEQEQIICEVRRVTKFVLDDVLFLLKPHMPLLTRSNLDRTLKRHNLNQLPKEKAFNINQREKGKFADYKMGYAHIDISRLMVNKQKFYCLLPLMECASMPILRFIKTKPQKSLVIF